MPSNEGWWPDNQSSSIQVNSSSVAAILPSNYSNFGYTVNTLRANTVPYADHSHPNVMHADVLVSGSQPQARKLTGKEWLEQRVKEITGVGHMALAGPV